MATVSIYPIDDVAELRVCAEAASRLWARREKPSQSRVPKTDGMSHHIPCQSWLIADTTVSKPVDSLHICVRTFNSQSHQHLSGPMFIRFISIR